MCVFCFDVKDVKNMVIWLLIVAFLIRKRNGCESLWLLEFLRRGERNIHVGLNAKKRINIGPLHVGGSMVVEQGELVIEASKDVNPPTKDILKPFPLNIVVGALSNPSAILIGFGK